MNTLVEDIIKLIRAALTHKKEYLSDGFSLRTTFPVVKAHDIAALCYYGALECGLSTDTSEMTALFDVVCQHIFLNEQQEYLANEIFSEFDKKQIEYMPVKGILLKKLYPASEMRVMGDLDILIKTSQYDIIRDIMQKLEYTETNESDHELIWCKNGIQVELHKRLIPSYNKDYYAYFGDGWRLAKQNDGTKYSMTDEDELIYLFTHYAKHYRDGGVGIKQTVDLWLYRQSKPNLDESYIKNELTTLCLYEFYTNVMQTLSVWFDGGIANEKTKLITITIFKSGSFGFHDEHVISSGVKARETSGTKNSAKRNRIRQALFLPYADMCKKYPVLEKAPILLPFMWVRRWVEALFRKRETIQSTINDISLMSEENLNAYQRNLDSVGLAFNFTEE